MTVLGRLVLGRYTGLLVALVAVGVYLALTEDVFLTWDNLMNIGKSNSVVFVLAIGATFVIISGGIDLSIASAATAAGMILGLTMEAGWSIALVLAVTLLFGLCLGLLNGVLITRLRISFLVVTLGTLSIYQSFALVVNGGQTISVFGKPGFSVLSDFVNDEIGPFPVLLVFDLALLLVAGGVLRYSGFGRSLFAVGSNPEAARLNGINVGRILLITCAVSGLTAGLASVVQVGRLTGASAQADPTLLLDRDRCGPDRRHDIHGRRGGRAGDAHRGVVPRRRSERAHACGRALVLAGHRQRRAADPGGRAGGSARPRLGGSTARPSGVKIRGVKLFAMAAVLMAALVIGACGEGDDQGSGSGSATVAYSNPVGAQPGQQDIVFGFKAGAEELGWTAESIDANLSPDKQVADIATMVTQGVDGIASWTLDPGAAAGAYGQAKAAGIPVVGVNSEGSGIVATVWWENNLCGPGSPIAEHRAVHRGREAGCRGAGGWRSPRPVDPGL